MRALMSSPDAADSDHFMTSSKKAFSAESPHEREQARPTSRTRHNNPHAASFRSTQLPSGQLINVSRREESDAAWSQLSPRGAEGEVFKTPPSVAAGDFGSPSLQPWQKGNTKRYGSNAQPWASTTVPALGIVPQLNKQNLDVLSRTMPTTRETYAAPTDFNRVPTSRRAPSRVEPETQSEIRTIVRDDISSEVEAWIEGAPGFEGEVVKRMIREVSAKARTPRGEARTGLGQTSPSQPAAAAAAASPTKVSYISSWAGPLA